jgi:hypothetical protein
LFSGNPTVSVLYTSIIATRNINNAIFCDVDAYPNAVTVSWNITLDDTVVVHTGAATGKYDVTKIDMKFMIATRFGSNLQQGRSK